MSIAIAIDSAVALPLVLIQKDGNSGNDSDDRGDNINNAADTDVQYEWNCSELVDVTTICETSVAETAALHRELEFPSHLEDIDNFNPVLQEGDFDVAGYLDVLDHLPVANGAVLEYVYNFDGMGGYRILYMRQENEEPFATVDEYRSALRGIVHGRSELPKALELPPTVASDNAADL